MRWLSALIERLTSDATETMAIPCPRCGAEITIAVRFGKGPEIGDCPRSCELTADERIDMTDAANREHARRVGW